MNAYAEIDPHIGRWANKHSLIINSSPWNGGESRAIYLSSNGGECFQIWIERPVGGLVRLHAAGVESRRDDAQPTNWIVPIHEASEALETAYETVLRWMRPFEHHSS